MRTTVYLKSINIWKSFENLRSENNLTQGQGQGQKDKDKMRYLWIAFKFYSFNNT